MQKPYRGSAFEAGLRDWCTPSMLAASAVPFIVLSALTLGGAAAYFSDAVAWTGASFDEITRELERAFDQLGASKLVETWMMHAAVRGASTFMLGALMTSTALVISLVGSLVVLGFMTPWISRIIRRRNYPQIDAESFSSPLEGVLYVVLVVVGFAVAFVLLTPVYFIPAIGFVCFNVMAYLLFKALLVRDVASCVMTREEYRKVKQVNRVRINALTALLFVLSLVPVFGLFLQVLFACILSHFFLREVEELRQARRFLAVGS